MNVKDVYFMIKTILVDDERFALVSLENQLKKHDDIQVEGAFTNIEEAFGKIEEGDIDVVFLDINMPKLNGFEVAERINNMNEYMQIVFVTAYDEYAIKAFEVDALDYVMKPITKKRLEITLNRIREKNILLKKSKKQKENAIQSFGSFQIVCNNATVKWRTKKAKELMAYLLHYRGRFIHRDKILDLIWNSKSNEQTMKLLHTNLYYIRKALKGTVLEDCIEYSSEMYKVDVSNIDYDVDIFENKINANDEMSLKKAIDLYKGDYFEEEAYSWSVAEQERLSKIYGSVLMKFTKDLMESKEYGLAVHYLKKRLDKEPYDEESHLNLMKAHIEMKDGKAFLEHYEKVKCVFEDDLKVKLPLRIKKLYEETNMK